jgi:CMP-N-acetylneuraminic acid synthetase
MNKSFNVTALLPMKGHSERIPNKNLKIFAGKPLCFHILEALQNSALISSIIINTDSKEIAGAVVPFFSKVKIHERPSEICGDFVPMNDVIAFDLSNSSSDLYIQTHSTNPLLKRQTIEKAIEEFLTSNHKYDSAFSVTRLQTRLYWQDGKPVNHNPDELLRTQDLPPVFEENSNFYIFTKESFANAGNRRIGVNSLMYEIPKTESIDIDTPEDFLLAELLFKKMN